MLKCFMLEQTRVVKIYLRRYANANSDTDSKCKGAYGYHDAMVLIGEEEVYFQSRKNSSGGMYVVRVDDPYIDKYKEQYPYGDPKWPTFCDECGYKFKSIDEYQIFTDLVYKRSDTGEECNLRKPPEGAMYWAWWFKDNPRYAPNGALHAVCPGGHPWNIDGRASNCTMPDDDEHRCWVRHGEPPNITVDKNGLTCDAGGGSIQAGSYHGFLQNGHFT